MQNMRITVHPIVGCGLILLFALLGAQAKKEPASAPPDARVAAFRQSYASEAAQDYRGAVEALQKVPSQRQDYLLALRLGWLYAQARDPARSLVQYEQAAKYNGGSVEPLLGMLSTLIAQERYADAEKACRQILLRDPQHYTANLRLAYVARIQGKGKAAEQITRTMTALYPSDRDFLIEHALNLSNANKSKDAQALYQNVLLIAPDDPVATQALAKVRLTSKAESVVAAFRRANSLASEQKYREAAAALKTAQPTRQQEYIHRIRLGWLHYLAGDYAASAQNYEQAAQAAPKAVEPLLGHLLPLLAQQDYATAEKVARGAVKISPLNYYAGMRQAHALRMQEKFAEADTLNRALLALYPTDTTLLAEQALVLTGLDRTQEAGELYRLLETLTPAPAAEK